MNQNASRPDGPWDVHQTDCYDVYENRLDLGAFLVPNIPDLEVHVDIDGDTGIATSARLVLHTSTAQVQVYASPKDHELWTDIRLEIEENLAKQGIPATREFGRFGPELQAMLPTSDVDGRSFLRAVRFIGVDGDRWFLRGVITGDAAIDELAWQQMDDVVASLVIIRGEVPMGPGEPLPIELPE